MCVRMCVCVKSPSCQPRCSSSLFSVWHHFLLDFLFSNVASYRFAPQHLKREEEETNIEQE